VDKCSVKILLLCVIAYQEPYKIFHSLIKLRLFIHVVPIIYMRNSADVKKVIKTTRSS